MSARQIKRRSARNMTSRLHWLAWMFGRDGVRAQKRTRLYIVGCKPGDIPVMPMALGEATHTVGLWSGRNKAMCRPSISKPEYEGTPPEFARWLIDLARRCQVEVAA